MSKRTKASKTVEPDEDQALRAARNRSIALATGRRFNGITYETRRGDICGVRIDGRCVLSIVSEVSGGRTQQVSWGDCTVDGPFDHTEIEARETFSADIGASIGFQSSSMKDVAAVAAVFVRPDAPTYAITRKIVARGKALIAVSPPPDTTRGGTA